jgi:hypothetical protein
MHDYWIDYNNKLSTLKKLVKVMKLYGLEFMNMIINPWLSDLTTLCIIKSVNDFFRR